MTGSFDIPKRVLPIRYRMAGIASLSQPNVFPSETSSAPGARISSLWNERGKQVLQFDFKELLEVEQLEILHMHLPRFNLGEPASRAIPSFQLQFCDQNLLRPTFAIAQLANRRSHGVLDIGLRHTVPL